MMPSDAYEQRMEHYDRIARESEQWHATHTDPQQAPLLKSHRRTWPIASVNLRFVVLLLGFTSVVLIAYA